MPRSQDLYRVWSQYKLGHSNHLSIFRTLFVIFHNHNRALGSITWKFARPPWSCTTTSHAKLQSLHSHMSQSHIDLESDKSWTSLNPLNWSYATQECQWFDHVSISRRLTIMKVHPQQLTVYFSAYTLRKVPILTSYFVRSYVEQFFPIWGIRLTEPQVLSSEVVQPGYSLTSWISQPCYLLFYIYYML